MHHNNKTHTDGGKERKREGERETLGHGEDNIVECSARQQGRGEGAERGSTADEPKSSSSSS